MGGVDISLYFLQEFHSVHPGHHDIGHNEVDIVVFQFFQCVNSVYGGHHAVSACQAVANHLKQFLIVVDHHYGAWLFGRVVCGVCGVCGLHTV